MSSIKEHLDNILKETIALHREKYITGPDEFVAINDIEIAVHEARKVFERTKNIDKPKAEEQ